VRFRIRLPGIDDEWQDVGGRRIAYYTRLRPGPYTFEVMAANGDGLSSGRPAVMQLVVAPFWWERRFVHVAGALERERTRIARDLHDDLGSRLAHLAILAETSGAADQDGRIVRAAREAGQMMDELVWAINARNDTVESFVYYLARFAEEHVAAAGLRCRLEIPVKLPDRTLAADVRRHLYLAVTNAGKHARATEVG
jgi:signal transduction histidine kinase